MPESPSAHTSSEWGTAAIPWKTKKQSSVALSPVEAEYIAMCQGHQRNRHNSETLPAAMRKHESGMGYRTGTGTDGRDMATSENTTKHVIYKSPCGAELQAHEHMAFEYQPHEGHWNIIDEGAPDHQHATLFGNRGPGRV